MINLNLRIVLQVFVERGKVDAYLDRRLPDGTLEPMELPSDQRTLDGLIAGAGYFLDGTVINEDERIGDSSEFEQEDDEPVPDVAFVIEVSRENKGIGITTQIFTLRSDGKLHRRAPADFPDKEPVIAQMSLLATELFTIVETTKAKWPITKTFTSTNGGRHE